MRVEYPETSTDVPFGEAPQTNIDEEHDRP